jgi:hypothetical protein
MLLLLKLWALKLLWRRSPLAPKTSDYDFAYASDTVEHNGRNPGHVVEISY